MNKNDLLSLHGTCGTLSVMITDENLVLVNEYEYQNEMERYIGHRVPKCMKGGFHTTHVCSWIWHVQPSRFAECESGLGLYKTNVIYTDINTGVVTDNSGNVVK